jgi:hypothetical protein
MRPSRIFFRGGLPFLGEFLVHPTGISTQNLINAEIGDLKY